MARSTCRGHWHRRAGWHWQAASNVAGPECRCLRRVPWSDMAAALCHLSKVLKATCRSKCPAPPCQGRIRGAVAPGTGGQVSERCASWRPQPLRSAGLFPPPSRLAAASSSEDAAGLACPCDNAAPHSVQRLLRRLGATVTGPDCDGGCILKLGSEGTGDTHGCRTRPVPS
jgi:hypothetical protein